MNILTWKTAFSVMSNVYRNLRGDRKNLLSKYHPHSVVINRNLLREVPAEYMMLCWVLRTWGGEWGWESRQKTEHVSM